MNTIDFQMKTVRLKAVTLKKYPVIIAVALALLAAVVVNAAPLVVSSATSTVEGLTIPSLSDAEWLFVVRIHIIYSCRMVKRFHFANTVTAKLFAKNVGLPLDEFFYCLLPIPRKTEMDKKIY